MRRNTKEMLSDMDYIVTLSKEERRWLYKAVSGITNANKATLKEIVSEGVALPLQADCEDARNSFRRDLMTLGQRVESGNFSEDEAASYLPCIREEITMGSFEDAMIEKIDNERMHGKPYSMGSYGNNEDVPVGADVVICIEGHALQNRLGKVTAKRRGQYLVEIQTTKGDVTIFVSAHEIARVNTMKQVAG